MASPSPIPREYVLALSGGGLRATLFHLGVIKALHANGALSRVTRICSVSGGSILAAHLAIHWQRYTGTAATFAEAAQDVVRFAQHDVRGRTVRRWLLATAAIVPQLAAYFVPKVTRFVPKLASMMPKLAAPQRFSLSRLLMDEYDEFYDGANLGDFAHGPELLIAATSMTTGEPCAFTSRGFSFVTQEGHPDLLAAPNLPVSLAVTASSAFPPLFSPLRVDHELLHCDVRRFPTPQYLSDGGIFDNLGIERLVDTAAATGATVIVSDAEGNFDWTIGSTYTFPVSRNVRASDMLMKRISTLEYDNAKARQVPLLQCSIRREVSRDVDPAAHSPEVQRMVTKIRTDLDRFSVQECEALARHGASVAHAALAEAGITVAAASADDRSSTDTRDLKRADVRRYRLWAPADRVSWVMLFVIAAYGGVGYLPFYFEQQAIWREQLEIADRQWRVLDLVDDSTGEYLLLQHMTSFRDYRPNPQGGRFNHSRLLLARVRDGTVQCREISPGVYMPASGDGGAMHVGDTSIEVFFIAKPDTKLDYAVDGITFELSKSSLAAFRSVPLFTGMNWGFFPRYVESGQIVHFSFSGYFEMVNVTQIAKSSSDVMSVAREQWLRSRSGGRLPAKTIRTVFPDETVRALQTACTPSLSERQD
jgi:predicted acylesterase/phospholipase RssA